MRFLLQAWLGRLPKQTRVILLTAIYGGAAGLVAVAFQAAMNAVDRAGLVTLSQQSTTAFVWGSLAMTVGTALVAGWLLQSFSPDAAGSGIPQLKTAFQKDFGFVPARLIWLKFIAGVLQIGGGSSLGREGPSVQLAGAVGSNLAGLAGKPKQRRRHGAATGAAAGLAAAFNTPLASVTFVLEELIGDLNSRLLGGVLLAAMVGALVTHGLLGPQPAFALARVGEPTWRAYSLVPVVAALAALVGMVFQNLSLRLRALNQRTTTIPAWIRPGLGALLCWALGVVVFLKTGRLGVFGLGYGDLSDALAGKVAWQLAAVLLAAKLFATVACYGSGGCGGIFSPTLFFGAMTGLVVAGLAHLAMPLKPDGMAMLAVVGMSATLGAVVRAPVTSILIVFEMTHEFALVPPLMLGAIISQTVSRRLARHNFYDSLIEQDGHDLARLSPPRDLRAWQEQPVSALANPRPVLAESLAADSLQALLSRHPFERFPVVESGRLRGVLTRAEAMAALRENRPPLLRPAVTCAPTERLRVIGERLVESSSGIVILQENETCPVIGLVTLHDLLRAELAAAERGNELE